MFKMVEQSKKIFELIKKSIPLDITVNNAHELSKKIDSTFNNSPTMIKYKPIINSRNIIEIPTYWTAELAGKYSHTEVTRDGMYICLDSKLNDFEGINFNRNPKISFLQENEKSPIKGIYVVQKNLVLQGNFHKVWLLNPQERVKIDKSKKAYAPDISLEGLTLE
jgi:hypothetical protein